MPKVPPYSPEFKREAVQLLRSRGRPAPQLAKLYLVAVQDLYSRRIVGWAMADHVRTELVVDALQMALAHRRPDPGLIWHSDQGSQFVSLAFGQQAPAAGIA